MTQDNSEFSRRTALQTITGTAFMSIAGCLNNGGGGEPSGGNGDLDKQNTLKRVTVDGTTLVVELTEAATVDQINLIQPNDELFGKHSVATGSRQVTFDIGTSYTPGKYRVIALKGEETVVETSLSIQPNLRIVEMGIGGNQPEKMWDGDFEKVKDEAFVTVKNSGSGPEVITKLLFIGEVPYPSDEEGTNYANKEDVSGIYDPKTNSEVEKITIKPEEQVTLYSFRSPFAFVRGEGTSCKSKKQTGEFTLILETQVGEKDTSKTYSIRYSASEQFNSCEITIGES